MVAGADIAVPRTFQNTLCRLTYFIFSQPKVGSIIIDILALDQTI